MENRERRWSLSAPEKPEKEEKNNINVVQINKQIRDLIRKRAEIRKSGRRRAEVITGRNGDLEDNQYPPLPRRKRREKPRIISNIRIVPSDPSRDSGTPRDPSIRNRGRNNQAETGESGKELQGKKKWANGSGHQEEKSTPHRMENNRKREEITSNKYRS